MRCLIVEDEFTSRRILQRILAGFADCDMAVNGAEAVEALKIAQDEGDGYALVCLDIMLPDMSGQDVLEVLRELESTRGVDAGHGAKVIVTTSLKDKKNIMKAFRGGAESYLVKPIRKDDLLEQLEKLGFSQAA